EMNTLWTGLSSNSRTTAYKSSLVSDRAPVRADRSAVMGSASHADVRSAIPVRHVLRDPHGLLDQGLDDVGLLDRLAALTLDEDLALAVARGDAEVGLPCLTGAVHHTPHHGDPERYGEALQSGGDLVGQLVDVDLGTSARRARHDLQLAGPQVERLEDL